MAGIVSTSTIGVGSVRTYKAVFTSTSTSVAINWISGTTSAASTPFAAMDKGSEVTFQNISTGAFNVWLGGEDLAINNGIVIAQNGTYAVGKTDRTPGVQLSEWYVCTTSSVAVVIAQLVKM